MARGTARPPDIAIVATTPARTPAAKPTNQCFRAMIDDSRVPRSTVTRERVYRERVRWGRGSNYIQPWQALTFVPARPRATVRAIRPGWAADRSRSKYGRL